MIYGEILLFLYERSVPDQKLMNVLHFAVSVLDAELRNLSFLFVVWIELFICCFCFEKITYCICFSERQDIIG